MCCTQGCRNGQLRWLLIAIPVYEICRALNDDTISYGFYTFWGSFVIAFGSLIHWLITRAYLKVAQSAKEDLEQVKEGKDLRMKQFSTWLRKMDILALIYLGVNAIQYYEAVKDSDVGDVNLDKGLKAASEFNTFLLQSVFMAIWGFSLFDLYKQIKKSDRITPEKGVFIVHGVLLILYLTFDLAIIVTTMFSANYCSRQSSDHYCGTS